LNVTRVDNLSDPIAQPAIDRCSSRLRSTGEGEIELTIRWRDRNCPVWFDEDDAEDCDSRTRFAFSAKDLGVEEILESSQDPDTALQKLLVVDAFFTRENQPEGRHPTTGVLTTPRSEVHLVVRVIRAGRTVDPQAATAIDASHTPPHSTGSWATRVARPTGLLR